jgi:hypothetical protein
VAVNKNSPHGKTTSAPTATLIAQVPVVIVDVSRSGGLIETTRPLDPGTIGTLQLVVGGRQYVEDFRVARCTSLSGRGSTFRIGIEFLRTRRVADASLRHAVTHLVALNAGRAGAKGGSDRRAARAGTKGVKHETASAGRAVYR